MPDPAADPCYCRPGYKCPYCAGAEQRAAKRRAQKREGQKLVAELREGDDAE